jgi:hypothetical protein
MVYDFAAILGKHRGRKRKREKTESLGSLFLFLFLNWVRCIPLPPAGEGAGGRVESLALGTVTASPVGR